MVVLETGLGCPVGCGAPPIPRDVLDSITPDEIRKEMLAVEKQRLLAQMAAWRSPQTSSDMGDGVEDDESDSDNTEEDGEPEQETVLVLGQEINNRK